jgi:hypothetical protein
LLERRFEKPGGLHENVFCGILERVLFFNILSRTRGLLHSAGRDVQGLGKWTGLPSCKLRCEMRTRGPRMHKSMQEGFEGIHWSLWWIWRRSAVPNRRMQVTHDHAFGLVAHKLILVVCDSGCHPVKSPRRKRARWPARSHVLHRYGCRRQLFRSRFSNAQHLLCCLRERLPASVKNKNAG